MDKSFFSKSLKLQCNGGVGGVLVVYASSLRILTKNLQQIHNSLMIIFNEKKLTFLNQQENKHTNINKLPLFLPIF